MFGAQAHGGTTSIRCKIKGTTCILTQCLLYRLLRLCTTCWASQSIMPWSFLWSTGHSLHCSPRAEKAVLCMLSFRYGNHILRLIYRLASRLFTVTHARCDLLDTAQSGCNTESGWKHASSLPFA